MLLGRGGWASMTSWVPDTNPHVHTTHPISALTERPIIALEARQPDAVGGRIMSGLLARLAALLRRTCSAACCVAASNYKREFFGEFVVIPDPRRP
jgi:hypothetical protein